MDAGDIASLVVSICALVFSFYTFLLVRRLQIAQFDIARDSSFEGRLGEWHEAFKLHGIDLEEAKNEGILPQQIAYMILSVNGLISYCIGNDIEISEHLKESDYRQRMFAQSDTRRAWRYARLCIPKDDAGPIDKYLEDKYQEKYTPL